MTAFDQFHYLTFYAPSNLVRDDLGRPKTAKVGGVDRLRIPSQSIKRACRVSDHFKDVLSGHIGIRTRKMGRTLFQHLIDRHVSEEKAKEWVQLLLANFGEINTAKSLDFSQIVHFSVEEQKALMDLADRLIAEKRNPSDEELKLLRKEMQTVDIALWGRMLASSPQFNVEAAVQVAHAISVNPIVIESDYFGAVDDLNAPEDSGSAFISELGFGSGVFYGYVCVNRNLLLENLGHNQELVKRTLRALVTAIATVSPTGKQNSFASRACASYMLAEKGSSQPRQLSSAFLKPVKGPDFINESVEIIERLYKKMDKVYGEELKRYSFNVEKGEGSLKELLQFIVE